MERIFTINNFVFFCLITLITSYNLSFAQNGDYLYTDVTDSYLPSSLFGSNMSAAAADLDGDNDLDLVVAREFQANGIFYNNGDGVFTNVTLDKIPAKIFDSEEIAIGDFNNDQLLDIIFVSEDNAVHEYYINDGNNNYTDVGNRMPKVISNTVQASDFNNDGNLDIIIGTAEAPPFQGSPANPSQNLILINNGDGTFEDETSVRLPEILDVTQDISIGDIDNDNDDDIVVGNEDGNKIYINDGNGNFTDGTAMRLPAANEETRKITLADVDGDEDLDLFFSNVAFRNGKNIQDRILINDGAGKFTDETSERIPSDSEHTMDAAFTDVDFDGDLDLITANIFFNRPAKVFKNNGSGVFEEKTSEVFPPGVNAEGIGIIVADFNSDSFDDIYIVNRRSSQQPNTKDRLLLRNNPDQTTGILYENDLPESFKLLQNYPNPFNPATTIKFSIAKMNSQKVTPTSIKIYDALGNRVETIMERNLLPGAYSINYNASNLSSGVYYYRLIAERFSETKKFVLLK